MSTVESAAPKVSVVRSGWYKNDGILCEARPGWDGRRQSRKCRTNGCGKKPSFGVTGAKMPEYCVEHALDGMVNVKNRRCTTEGCRKQPSFGVAGSKTGEYCAQQAPDGMVNVYSRKCITEGCRNFPSFGVVDTRTTEYCAQHAPDGMVDVSKRKCRTDGCGKVPSFGVAGTRMMEYCKQHAPDGMVNVKSKKCRSEGCSKQPSFGVAGTKSMEYCALHSPYAIINVYRRKCTTKSCGKRPPFQVEGMKTAEYYAQQAWPRFGVEGYKKRKTDVHLYREETTGYAIPSGGKRKTIHPKSAQKGPPSGGTESSRKQARYLDTTSTGSFRAVARESAAGAVIMPATGGEEYPITRHSSMKIEVQLSL